MHLHLLLLVLCHEAFTAELRGCTCIQGGPTMEPLHCLTTSSCRLDLS